MSKILTIVLLPEGALQLKVGDEYLGAVEEVYMERSGSSVRPRVKITLLDPQVVRSNEKAYQVVLKINARNQKLLQGVPGVSIYTANSIPGSSSTLPPEDSTS